VEFAEFVPHGLEFQSEWSNGNAERLGCSEKAVIVGCEFDRLTAPQQKADRGKMQGVKCAHWNGKGLKGSPKTGGASSTNATR
jgi:hypothetical protein